MKSQIRGIFIGTESAKLILERLQIFFKITYSSTLNKR